MVLKPFWSSLQVRIIRILLVVGFFAGSSLMATVSRAKDIYIAQNAVGAGSGADCNDALGLNYLNSANNWAAGNTYHLCGTFTLPAGGAITVGGSGTASSPITVQFESGAVLQAHYLGGGGVCTTCQGAITVNGNYVTIDGGANGIIQNTANGTNLAYQHDSVGVYLNGSNLTVRNLTIQNMYMNQGSSSSANDIAGQNTTDIRVDNGSSNVMIYNNVLNNASIGISSDTSGSNVNYYNNTLNDHHWQMAINGSGSPNIYSNDISNFTNWQYPTSVYHIDGVIVFGNSSVIAPYIYNNYFHGDLGTGSPTGMVFCTFGIPGNGSGSACTIFNNVFVGTGFTATNDTAIYFHSAASGNPLGPHVIYNNTFVNFGYHIYTDGDNSTHFNIMNNIFIGSGGTYYISQGSNSPFADLAMNNNVYFGGRSSGAWNFGSNGSVYNSLSSWQSACGCDSASSTQNPGLNSSYQLTSNSPAMNIGANLSSMNISALDVGKPSNVGKNASNNGVQRSATASNWAPGAYGFGTVTPPAPPTALTATVQ